MLNRSEFIEKLCVILQDPKNESKLLEYVKKAEKERISLDLRNKAGRTPLSIAAEIGNLEYLKILLDAGAKVKALTAEKETAIGWASYKGHDDCVEELLARKPDQNLNRLNNAGKPILFYAVSGKHSESVKLLFVAGASMKYKPFRFLDLILSLIHNCNQRAADIPLAFSKIIEEHFKFSETDQKAYGLADNKLQETNGYITKLNKLTTLHQKNMFDYLDDGMKPFGFFPAVILQLIMQYDVPEQNPLKDERLDEDPKIGVSKLNVSTIDGYLDREEKLSKSNCSHDYGIRFYKKKHVSASTPPENQKRLRIS